MHRPGGLPTTSIFTMNLLGILLFSCLVHPTIAHADALSVAIVNAPQNAVPGQTVIFQGTVSNDTGVDLAATDLFFDFFSFDPTLDVNQLLGTPDFPIPNATATSIVDLFSVTVGTGAQPGSFPVNFVLQDVGGNLTAQSEVAVVVSATAVPEPSATSLFVFSLLVILPAQSLFRRNWKTLMHESV